MTERLLAGLSGVLSMLGTSPHPDALCAGLIEHLDEPWGAKAAAILAAFPPQMAILGFHGYEADEIEGLDAIPLDRTYPVPRAFLDSEIRIEEIRSMPDSYEGMRRRGGRTRLVIERLPDSVTVSVPIICRGRPVGGYSLLCLKDDWNTFDISALDTIGHALGVWLTHPDSGVPADGEEAPPLTARQVGILSMAAGGMSNPAIAQALAVSESTVKQEFSRLARSLNAEDRRATVARAIHLGVIEAQQR